MFRDILKRKKYCKKIIIDSQKDLYFTGDRIIGTFIVTAYAPLTVSHISISLRCDEGACVRISDGDGEHYEDHQERYVSIDRTVFPEHPIPNDGQTKDQEYTLKEGVYAYNFDFELPMGPQSVPNEPYFTSLRWYIEGVVRQGSKLTSNMILKYPIFVCPMIKTPFDINKKIVKFESVFLKVPRLKVPANDSSRCLKKLFYINSDTSEVKCYIKVPKDGIPQAPAMLPIEVDIRSGEEISLFLTKFQLDLKYKLLVSVGKYQNFDTGLLKITKMDIILPLEKAIAEIHEQLSRTSIKETIPATFRSNHLNLTYKLVAYFYISGQSSYRNVKKVRVSIPTVIRYKSDFSEESPPYESKMDKYI